jgi:hypothetical protein
VRFEECLDKGLIKEDPLAGERVESSLAISERFLRSSNRNLEIDEFYFQKISTINRRQSAAHYSEKPKNWEAKIGRKVNALWPNLTTHRMTYT